MYHRILVATDGSTLSKKAVNSAIAMAALCGAELTALKVIPRYAQSYYEGSIPLNATDVARIEGTWKADAEKMLAGVVKAGKDKGVVVTPQVVKSDLISEAIIKTAVKQKIELIVMASHGRSGIKRLLLGSETNHVLTHATIPALVLR